MWVRNIDWLPLICTLTRDQTHKICTCPDWEWNCNLSPNQLTHTLRNEFFLRFFCHCTWGISYSVNLYVCHRLLLSRVTFLQNYFLQSLNLPAWWRTIKTVVSLLNRMPVHILGWNLTQCWITQLDTRGLQNWGGPKLSGPLCSFNSLVYIISTHSIHRICDLKYIYIKKDNNWTQES